MSGNGGLPRSGFQARLAARVALAERADDVLVLDLRELVGFTDYFVIATAGSERRRQTVIEAIGERLREDCRRKPTHVEGTPAGGWLLADYVDFVVHVFSPESRALYQLERLWGDAPRWAPEPPSGGGGASPGAEVAPSAAEEGPA